MTLSPRQKLFAAGVLLALLTLVGAVQGSWSAASVARLVLGLSAVAGLAVWVWRARGGAGPASRFKAAPRLVVVQRVGLSQRNGLALIEVDGRPFIVVHGDGFARVRPAPRRVRLTLTTPEPAQPDDGELAQ
jgi:hypothetical protein